MPVNDPMLVDIAHSLKRSRSVREMHRLLLEDSKLLVILEYRLR
jgi:hypothetical protein